MAPAFGLSRQTQSKRRKLFLSLVASLTVATSSLSLSSSVWAGEDQAAANRLATYETAGGENFFALAVAPQVDDALRSRLSQGPRSVLIVVDTSATQTGDARLDSLEAASGVLDGLSAECQVAIAAVDVKTVMLSSTFAAADSEAAKTAIAKLEQRLPLGKTDLASALETGIEQLAGRSGHRSVIYIGDGSSLGKIRDTDYFEKVVDRLSQDQISVHSLVVGVSTDLGLLATLANHTGGVTLVRDANEQASGQQFGMMLAGAAGISPIWPTELTMPSGYDVVQESRIPPVRIDRDSVLIGRMTVDSVVAEKAQPVVLRGTAAGQAIELSWAVKPEESNLDFAFLPSLVVAAEPNDGLMLPTAGSAALRVAASAMAHRAQELVRAGRLALSQGNFKGARALAESALEIDPNHSEAKAILAAVAQEKTLTATQEGNPFGDDPASGTDDPFGGAFGDEAPAAEEATPAAGDDDPFGDAFDTPAAGAPGTLGEVAGDDEISPFEDGAADAVVPPPGAAILRDEPSGLLDRFEGERTALEGQWRAEVRAALGSARIGLPLDPVGVYSDLKGLMSRVEAVPELGPAVRQTLLAQLQAAAQQASRAVTVYEETQANLQQQQAAAAATTRLLQESIRREARLANAVELFNGLIVEGDYESAIQDVTPMIQELDGYRTIGEQANAYGDLGLSVSRANRYRDLRHRAFVDALSLNERALIPFVDEPPVVYPDSEVWARLSVRRLARYGAIELTGSNDSERRIYNALENEYSGNFNQIPLEDAVRQIATENDIPIIINTRALEDIGLTRDVPITVNLKNVSLRSFLRIMLRENDLAYMIKDEVLQITTDEDANSEDNMITKVYPVGDLVVPVINLGGMGGMMGGMGGMGGGMGGMGGGMGGMGGGMGGMGGGMGGMGGGMGGMGGMGMGGMMSMPDDVSLAEKANKPADADQNRGDVPIRVTPQAGQSLDAAWNEHFKQLNLSTPEAVKTHDARIRTTVRQLNLKASNALADSNTSEAQKYFEEVRAVIAGALLNGAVQPWMHQGYALALEGTGAPREEVERALLSAADIATSPEELLLLAGHLERLELYSGAFELCRDAVRAQPYHREAYLVGLRLAKEMDDVDALAWACEGVLGQAWQAGQERLENEVRLLARATYQQLIEDGKAEKAETFAKSVNGAMVRDCIVEVTWTGDADIDLMIEEPSGTICSLQNPRSSGGGVLIGDGYSTGRAEKDGQITETYVCPEGFSGQYRLLVKRVWGEVSTGQVTVRILTDVGRPSQRLIQETVALEEKDALFVFEVKEGRRQQEMAAAQVEQLAEVQNRLNGTILAQIGNGENNPGAPNLPGMPNVPGNGGIGDPGDSNNADLLRAFYRDRRLMQLARAGGFGRGAVGYQPQISVIPEGTMMQVMGVISGDRRYVRISPAPSFTSITDVSTFNFVTGDTGGGGAGGGIGGGGGGIGGGGGGIGGGGFGGGGGGGIL